jgi:hypothetical protein
MYGTLGSIYSLFNLATIPEVLGNKNMSNHDQIEEVGIENATSVDEPHADPAPPVTTSAKPKPKRNFGIQPTVFNRPNGKSYFLPFRSFLTHKFLSDI